MAITTPIEYEHSFKTLYGASEKAFVEYFAEIPAPSNSAPLIEAPLFSMDAPRYPPEASDRQTTQKGPGRPKKRKADDILTDDSPIVASIRDYISPEEQELRTAEAGILFPKYMDKFRAKRAKKTPPKRKSGQNRLAYLPSEEYATEWDKDVYRCPPSMDQKQLSKTLHYFKQDCREPGAPVSVYAPNPIVSNPKYFDLEWNRPLNPLRPVFVDPPQRGSLDNTPSFSRKRLSNPEHQVAYDSFVLELKRAMGSDYIDLNDLQYYPRSDGRADAFLDEKSKKYKIMKNAKYSVEHCLRNRDIERAVKAVRILYEIKGLSWSDALAEHWDRRIVQFVNPKTVCNGRAFNYEMQDLDAPFGRNMSPEPFEPKTTEPPAGMQENELGTKFYWSGTQGRMVSFDVLREQKTEMLVKDLNLQNSTSILSEGRGSRSKLIKGQS